MESSYFRLCCNKYFLYSKSYDLCCNGLLYLNNGGVKIGSHSPSIFNPMTHEFFPIHVHDPVFYIEFGFSPNTKKFKLFLVHCPATQSDHCMQILRFGTNNNEWISVSLPSPSYITSHDCDMDGVIYFLGRDDNEYLMTIHAFDVDTERFKVVAVLEVGACPGQAFLQHFNGTIYAKFFIHESSQVQIWRMQAKDSWVKECTICGDFTQKSLELLKASGDEKIFIQMSEDLFWLNKSTSTVKMENKIKTLNIPPPDNKFIICALVLYTLHFGSLSSILAGHEPVMKSWSSFKASFICLLSYLIDHVLI